MILKLPFLISCTFLISGSVNAQTLTKKFTHSSAQLPAQIMHDENMSGIKNQNLSAPALRKAPSTNQVSALSLVPIGVCPNANGVAVKNRSNINYNQDLNTLVVIHRGTVPPALTTGYFYYDISSNGGSTWSVNQGPVYSDPKGSADWYRGRFPSADIYNPGGNTNLSNARIVYAAPWTNGLGTPLWCGKVYGVGSLDNAPAGRKSHVDSLTTSLMENIFVTKPGIAWRIGEEYQFGTSTFNETLDVGAGEFNSFTGDFDYQDVHFAVPLDMANFGEVGDCDVVFADDGQTGYIVVITNNDAPDYLCFTDTTAYISVYKTTDGGINWSSNIDLNFSKTADTILNNGTAFSYSPGADQDVVIDANNNLHIISTVHISIDYNYETTPGTWGVFDIYTTDQGTTWQAELLDKPQTYEGVFGNGVGSNAIITEDIRPFASRTTDGSKLFFGWFDTDTVTFSGVGNTHPDLHVKGYDLASGKWTAAMNLTKGTAAAGGCTFGNGAYYAIDNGSAYTIPVFIQTLVDSNSTGAQTQLNYLNGATVNSSDFTLSGSPVAVPVSTCTPVQPPQTFFLSVSSKEVNDPAHLNVLGNYPNPFNGITRVVLSIPRSGDVTLEVNNLMGQVLSSTTYRNLSSGKNYLTIDCSDFASGLYFYTVKYGNEIISKTISVE